MRAKIDYVKLIKKRYNRPRGYDPMASYFSSMGATIHTGDFADKFLNIDANTSLFAAIYILIVSARRQNDFDSLEIQNIDSSKHISLKEKKILEQISLTEIENKNDIISIKLIEKEIYDKEIQPFKSLTQLHPNYKSQDELDEMEKSLVPQIPTLEIVISLLKLNGINNINILNDIKNCHQQ